MIKKQAGDIVGNSIKVQRIFRRSQLQDITGYSISHIYELIEAKKFPKPVPLGERAVGWLEDDIAEWQRRRIEARDDLEV